jgi:hypothetical protein
VLEIACIFVSGIAFFNSTTNRLKKRKEKREREKRQGNAVKRSTLIVTGKGGISVNVCRWGPLVLLVKGSL